MFKKFLTKIGTMTKGNAIMEIPKTDSEKPNVIANQTKAEIEEKTVVISSIKEETRPIEEPKIEIIEPVVHKDVPHVVEFRNVFKRFGEKTVLSDVTFKVEDIPNKGELIAIIGQSGCGKSTLLRLIAGLEPHYPQTSGEAYIFGKPLAEAGPDRGVVDQSYSLFPHLTVLKNVAFGLRLKGVGKKERYSLAHAWIEKVGLKGNEEKFPHQLSGGMRQRVAIASTLIMKPKIILMDEPFGALDPKIRRSAWKLLIDLWKEQESTVFIVTHSMEEAFYLGDRIFRMGTNPGRLVEIIQAPRPDIPAEEMRKQSWFTDSVNELQRRLETEAPPSGELSFPK